MKKVRISELPESKDLKGLYTVGTDANNNSVKVPLESTLQGIETVIDDALKNKADLVGGKVPETQLPLGCVAGEAFPGEAGAALESTVEMLREQIGNVGSIKTINNYINRDSTATGDEVQTIDNIADGVYIVNESISLPQKSNEYRTYMLTQDTSGKFYGSGSSSTTTSQSMLLFSNESYNVLSRYKTDSQTWGWDTSGIVNGTWSEWMDINEKVEFPAPVSFATPITTLDELKAIGQDSTKNVFFVNSNIMTTEALDFSAVNGKDIYVYLNNVAINVANVNLGQNTWHFIGLGASSITASVITSASPNDITFENLALNFNSTIDRIYVEHCDHCNIVISGGSAYQFKYCMDLTITSPDYLGADKQQGGNAYFDTCRIALFQADFGNLVMYNCSTASGADGTQSHVRATVMDIRVNVLTGALYEGVAQVNSSAQMTFSNMNTVNPMVVNCNSYYGMGMLTFDKCNIYDMDITLGNLSSLVFHDCAMELATPHPISIKVDECTMLFDNCELSSPQFTLSGIAGSHCNLHNCTFRNTVMTGKLWGEADATLKVLPIGTFLMDNCFPQNMENIIPNSPIDVLSVINSSFTGVAMRYVDTATPQPCKLNFTNNIFSATCNIECGINTDFQLRDNILYDSTPILNLDLVTAVDSKTPAKWELPDLSKCSNINIDGVANRDLTAIDPTKLAMGTWFVDNYGVRHFITCTDKSSDEAAQASKVWVTDAIN